MTTLAPMRAHASSIVVAALLPLLFVANAVRVLESETWVRTAYSWLGDEPVLTKQRRVALALEGLRAIDPLRKGGVGRLRDERLADGSPAFTRKELAHMEDVRVRVAILHVYMLLATAVLVVLAIIRREAFFRGLRYGAWATLGIAGSALVAMAVSFPTVLLGFHKLFFRGESWHFFDTDTIIRVYPERFWSWTGVLLGLIVLVEVIVALVLAKAIERRTRTLHV